MPANHRFDLAGFSLSPFGRGEGDGIVPRCAFEAGRLDFIARQLPV